MWFLCFLFYLIWGLELSRLPDWVNFHSGQLFLHKICFNRNISDKLHSPKKFFIFNSIISLDQKKRNSNFACPKLYKITRDFLFCPICQTARFYRWRCEIKCTFRSWPSDIFGEKKIFYPWHMLYQKNNQTWDAGSWCVEEQCKEQSSIDIVFFPNVQM